MSNITEEEARSMIVEFVQHVFEEVQVEGWKARRNELLIRQNLEGTDEGEMPDDITTFDKAMEHYGGDMDEVLSFYLYPILSSSGWVESWIYQNQPELDERARGVCYWNMWEDLYDFMYTMTLIRVDNQLVFQKKKNLEVMKEVLSLNVCFK